MLSMQEIPLNEHKAIIIALLFGVPLPRRYDDKEWRKIELKLEKHGHFEIAAPQNVNITYRTHEKFIQRFETAYGITFNKYIGNETKVKAFVEDLYADSEASYDELALKYDLMTLTEKKLYKNKLERQRKYGPDPEPVYHKFSIDYLLNPYKKY